MSAQRRPRGGGGFFGSGGGGGGGSGGGGQRPYSGARSSARAAEPPVTPAIKLLHARDCKAAPSGSFVSFLGVLVTVDEPRTITRRDSTTVQTSTMLVADHTERFLQVKLWGHLAKQTAVVSHCLSRSEFSVGRVVLFHEFEISRFRDVASAASKSRSTVRLMPDETAGDAASSHAADDEHGHKRRKLQHGAFQSAHHMMAQATSGTQHPPPHADLVARASNWSEVVAAAKALLSWAQVDGDGIARLYRAPDANARGTTSAVDHSTTPSAAASSLASASRTTSLFSLTVGAIPAVAVRLRSCHIVRGVSTPGHAAAAGAAPSTTTTLVALLSESSSDAIDGATSDDNSASFHDEILVELELRSSKWLDDSWRLFWKQNTNQRLRIEHVRAQWQADAIVLVDTPNTSITVERSPVTAAAIAVRSTFRSSSSNLLPSVQGVTHRSSLLAIEFPLLTSSHRQSLHRLLHAHSFPFGAPPPLPWHLFTMLFYSACTRCLRELEPDENEVYACVDCLTTIERPSQAMMHPNENRPGMRWMYREAVARVRPSKEDDIAAASSSSASSLLRALLLDHESVSQLFGGIDPSCLVEATSAFSAPPPLMPPSTPDPSQDAPPPCSPSVFPRLALRFQWYRLFLALPTTTTSSAATSPLCSYTLAHHSSTEAATTTTSVMSFTLWP